MSRVFFAVIIVGGLVLSSVCFGYSGGSGTLEDPYLITTAEDMNQIGRNYQDWDKHFKLIADIDLSAYTGTQFSRIGTDYQHAFNGVFDGDGHTIFNFTYTAENGDYIGIFGNVSNTGTIENVFLADVNIVGHWYIGGLVGYNGGTISNCHVTGNITGGYNSYYVGGLVGYSDCGNISNCSSTGNVTGGEYSSYLGGLVGGSWGCIISYCYSASNVTGGDYSYYLGGLIGYYEGGYYGPMSYCYSTGNVSGGYNSDYVGGLVGEMRYYVNVIDCYATGEVAGDYDVGGLVGMSSEQCTITRCYSSGSVSGYMYVGGLLGWNYGGTTTDSFWDVNTSGQTWSAGGTGKTTTEMKTESTFADAGWDLWNVWFIKEGVTYPQLRWSMTRYSGGTGRPTDPFRIATAEDLNDIGNHYEDFGKCFVLVNDIDLSAYTGTQFNIIRWFWGTFDGDNHTISDFTYDDANGMYYVGLFGEISGNIFERGVVKNLSLIDVNVRSTGMYTGGLAGGNYGGTISNCFCAGNVSGSEISGVLAGTNSGRILYCRSDGSVTGVYDVGGLVGYNEYNSIISDSYSTAAVTSTTADGPYVAGGLVGMNYSSSVISNCFSTGEVSGNCYNGGLVGWSHNSTTSNCFWDTNTSGQSWSGGGDGKTTAEMMTESTFTSAGWDFSNIWSICEGTNYPRLRWQIPAADWVCPDGVNIEDLDYFVQRWLLGDCASSNNCDGADINGSGEVDFADFAIFAQNWLEGTSP